MTDETPQPILQPGQVWQRNKDGGHVRVECLFGGGRMARLAPCTVDGSARRGGRTEAQAWRFDGSPGGYSFVAMVSP